MTQSDYQPVSIPFPVRLKPSRGFRFSFYLKTAFLNPEWGKLRQNKGFWVTGQTLQANPFSLDLDSSS